MSINAQTQQHNINFVNYLLQQQYYEETLFEAQRINGKQYSASQQDSLNFLGGWAAYNLKQLSLSSQLLSQVSKESSFYAKSHLFAGYNLLHLREFNQAKNLLSNFQPNTDIQKYFKNYLLAGNKLLLRNYASFDSITRYLPPDYYGFTSELKNLKDISLLMQTQHPRSVFLAAAMSTIIPGSGKIYAGKTGQGITAFLITTGLGLVSIENYNKHGIESFKTLFFGSVFSVFYLGNIYGSAFSAKLANNENYELHNQQILFNLHIPLRNIFN
jgi:TM2 domain-containing membrane protein YozV